MSEDVTLGCLNSRGMGIIEVVIAVGLLGVVMSGFASMMTYQVRQTQQTVEKFASLDLTRVLTQALTDTSLCTSAVTNPPLPSFDPSTIEVGSGPNLSLSRFPSSVASSAQPLVVADGVAQVSPLANSLKVKKLP